MDDVRAKIGRFGRILAALCTLACASCAAAASLGLVVLAAALAGVEPPAGVGGQWMATGAIEHLLALLAARASVGARGMLALRSAAFAVGQLFLLHVSLTARHIVVSLAGEEPFDAEAARTLRRSVWEVALLGLWNVLVALTLAVLTLLASYLIDYGCHLQARAAETSRIQEDMIAAIAEMTENKSGVTGRHVRRVSEYTRVLARALGLPAERVERIRLASMMHDVGKLLIPSEILEKPARLTDEEYATIRLHTTYGGQLLENVGGDVMELSRTIALDHHERFDGRGYARGLAGTDISLEGRIVAVADVYDALTSRRSYKEAWDERDAYDEIVRNAGTQFDPAVVEAFRTHYDEISEVRRAFQD